MTDISPTADQLQGAERPEGFDRRHAVSESQEKTWEAAGKPLHGDRFEAHLDTPSHTTYWVPKTTQRYARILDHGIRRETRGIVIHVNSGYWGGTVGFFTNGMREPYGSEGVGAHFEIGGRGLDGNASTSIYADHGPLQFLPIDAEAWHAVDANGFSVGVEHAGFGRTVAEWEKTHFNEIGMSAYRCAWILRRYNLGPPVISLTNPNHGNVWPHSCGGLSWGGHACPGPEFPWQLWLEETNRAYKQKWEWK